MEYELGFHNSMGSIHLDKCKYVIVSERFQRCFLSFPMLAERRPEIKSCFFFFFAPTAAVQWFLDQEILCGEKSSFFLLMSFRFR